MSTISYQQWWGHTRHLEFKAIYNNNNSDFLVTRMQLMATCMHVQMKLTDYMKRCTVW